MCGGGGGGGGGPSGDIGDFGSFGVGDPGVAPGGGASGGSGSGGPSGDIGDFGTAGVGDPGVAPPGSDQGGGVVGGLFGGTMADANAMAEAQGGSSQFGGYDADFGFDTAENAAQAVSDAIAAGSDPDNTSTSFGFTEGGQPGEFGFDTGKATQAGKATFGLTGNPAVSALVGLTTGMISGSTAPTGAPTGVIGVAEGENIGGYDGAGGIGEVGDPDISLDGGGPADSQSDNIGAPAANPPAVGPNSAASAGEFYTGGNVSPIARMLGGRGGGITGTVGNISAPDLGILLAILAQNDETNLNSPIYQ